MNGASATIQIGPAGAEAADDATAQLVEKTAAYRGPGPSLTPQTASEAKQRLAALSEDPAWVQNYFAGDVAARREAAALNELVAKGDDALPDENAPTPLVETATENELSQRNTISA